MIQPVRHDWPAIIRELEAAGITQYKLAVMMHRQIGWVQRIAQGQQPKHYEGEMLLSIHAEYVPRETFKNEPFRTQMLVTSA